MATGMIIILFCLLYMDFVLVCVYEYILFIFVLFYNIKLKQTEKKQRTLSKNKTYVEFQSLKEVFKLLLLWAMGKLWALNMPHLSPSYSPSRLGCNVNIPGKVERTQVLWPVRHGFVPWLCIFTSHLGSLSSPFPISGMRLILP